VVILGQDPYHNDFQANGLCFSVSDMVPAPPSLKNIYKELESDLNIKKNTNDLASWALQGVLLLNTTLTVKAHEANSHKDLGWEQFTDFIINTQPYLSVGLFHIIISKYSLIPQMQYSTAFI